MPILIIRDNTLKNSLNAPSKRMALIDLRPLNHYREARHLNIPIYCQNVSFSLIFPDDATIYGNYAFSITESYFMLYFTIVWSILVILALLLIIFILWIILAQFIRSRYVKN